MTARSDSVRGGGRGAPQDPASGSREALDAVATSAIALAKQAAQPPRRISVRHGDTSVEIEWDDAAPAPGRAAVAPVAAGVPETRLDTEPDDRLAYICSPVVGTFYHAAEPGAKPFVAVGDIVEPGTQVGIVEAMKLMNAIEADYAGEVVEVCVPNAAAVEYQQRLIAIAPIDLQG